MAACQAGRCCRRSPVLPSTHPTLHQAEIVFVCVCFFPFCVDKNSCCLVDAAVSACSGALSCTTHQSKTILEPAKEAVVFSACRLACQDGWRLDSSKPELGLAAGRREGGTTALFVTYGPARALAAASLSSLSLRLFSSLRFSCACIKASGVKQT